MEMNGVGVTEVAVPHLAESLVSATVGKWLKHPGDYVREYEVLCELMTDKVNVEMPSPVEGTIVRHLVQEGESAGVGTPICLIREPGAAHEATEEAEAVPMVDETAGNEFRARYSPAVLRLAKELKLELSQVKGTGLGGRITRKDILAHVKSVSQKQDAREAGIVEAAAHAAPPAAEESPAAATAAPSAKAVSPAEAAPPAPTEAASAVVTAPAQHQEQRLPASPLRSLIASRMRQSVAEIPHAWMTVEADVSNLVALRQKLKDRFASKEGVRLTYTPFVLKAIVNAIKDFPMLNSTWSENTIIVKKDIHLSIAVGSEESVVTPVLRHADRKTIAGLAIELDDLVMRAREGKLTLADLQGGTFTFNNTGAFGSVLSQPIINYPQAAILTFESIVRKPVVIHNDAIAIRSMVNLCLSLDHRILDGVVCGRFLQRVKHYLEQYDQDTVIY